MFVDSVVTRMLVFTRVSKIQNYCNEASVYRLFVRLKRIDHN